MSVALEVKGAIKNKAMAVIVDKAPVKESTVNVRNSVIQNSSTIDDSAVAGNTGIKIKAERVNIKNSHIHNSSKIKNSAVAGNTGVELGN